jgi:hypothetical protein
LISSVVANEVEAFKTRQEDRKLARVMSKEQIEQGAMLGKVDPGERDLQQAVSLENAIGVALQAFEDGLYFVFIDEIQQTNLDSEVFIKPKSKVVFLRLTALAGGKVHDLEGRSTGEAKVFLQPQSFSRTGRTSKATTTRSFHNGANSGPSGTCLDESTTRSSYR